MESIIKGNLSGYLCEDCLENIGNVKIRLYTPSKKEERGFKALTKKEIEKKNDFLVGEGVTNEVGDYEIKLKEGFEKGRLEFDFECSTVPKSGYKDKKFPTRQFHATTFEPDWGEEIKGQNTRFGELFYKVPHKWWCIIRGTFFDAWVICGRLMNCETGKAISGAKVTAMDADFLSDDTIGTTITDGTGHFRIDYTSIQFKQTFLSPWINVETDPGLPLKFQSGPDVYFKAELAGTSLIDETKANARKNVGYCLCVRLCSKINVIDPNDTIPSAWTGIGDTFSASFGTNAYDFDVDGFAGSNRYALYSKIRLTGQAALKSANGNPIEYRFVISDVTTPNGQISPAVSDFKKIIGVTPGLFSPSLILKLTKKIIGPSNNEIFVFSKQSDFDIDGWYDANKAIDRALLGAGLVPTDLSLYNIIEEDTLIALNTTALTNAPNVPGTIKAGQAIPNANKIPTEKVAIRFEIREVVNKPLNQFNVIPGSGKTLNSVVMNNNSVFMKLSIKELEDKGLCTPINGTVHAKYTVYHPYLTYTTLHLKNNSSSVNRYISDGVLPPPPPPSTNPTPITNELKSVGNGSAINNPPNDMVRCTYALKLVARARLHNGDNGISNQGPIEQLFFYDV